MYKAARGLRASLFRLRNGKDMAMEYLLARVFKHSPVRNAVSPERLASLKLPAVQKFDDFAMSSSELRVEYRNIQGSSYRGSSHRATASAIANLGQVTCGNDVQFIFSGDQAFKQMWREIGNAKRRVCIETYILEPDRVGKRTLSMLEQAGRRGLHIDLLYDGVGSIDFPPKQFLGLRSTGAAVSSFNPLFSKWPWERRHDTYFFRNHRKVMIIDECVAFCGGMNMSNEWITPFLGGTGSFRDTHARIEGPAVKKLLEVFESSLRESRFQRPRSKKPEKSSISYGDMKQSVVQVMQSNSVRGLREVQTAITTVVDNAKHTCYITSPYFLPPRKLRKLIEAVARRGVDVRLLTCGESDIRAVRWASQHIYRLFLQKGIRIYEMYGHVLHAKSISVDSEICAIGSFNWDFHSDVNLEVKMLLPDPELASQIHKQFLDDLLVAQEVTNERIDGWGWFSKIRAMCTYHIITSPWNLLL